MSLKICYKIIVKILRTKHFSSNRNIQDSFSIFQFCLRRRRRRRRSSNNSRRRKRKGGEGRGGPSFHANNSSTTIHQNRKLLLPSCIIILILLITRSPTPLSNHKFMAINFLFSNFYILVYLFIFISTLLAGLHQAHLQDTGHP